MAEISLVPAPKKIKIDIDPAQCVFCTKSFTKKSPAVTPDISKLQSVFDACRQRQDDIADRLLPLEQDILCDKIPLRYHRNCRSSYQSQHHIKLIVDKRTASNACISTVQSACGGGGGSSGVGASGAGGGSSEVGGFHTRSSSSYFDWKSKCFICGEACSDKHRSTWSRVESIDKDPKGRSLYNSILEAARLRHDDQMTIRLLGIENSDLVAVEARYHRKKNCLSTYINPRCLSVLQQKQLASSKHDDAILTIIDEFKPRIISERQVFTLSSIKQRFHALLIESGQEDPTYSSQSLKHRLQKLCPQIAFIPQKGKSDLVCSADVSVGEVLQKALKISQELKCDNLDPTHDTFAPVIMDEQETDETIIHKAVGILRRRLENTKPLVKEYYASHEMTLHAQKEFVDPLLLTTICWLTNRKCFQSAMTSADIDPKCLSIACDITTLATSVLSPKHVGLGVYLHHEYGSRKLVESMHTLGYTMSYDELRSFLTSVATYTTSNQVITPSGALVPKTIIPKIDGGQQVVYIADNWDHNEKTVDGRNTTHAMTSILVTPKASNSNTDSPRLPKCPQRTLQENMLQGGRLSRILLYKKPPQRPEPLLSQPVSLTELTPDNEASSIVQGKGIELIYNLSRSGEFTEEGKNSAVPPWGQFHSAILRDHEQPVSQVAFNPILMASPSDQSTIYTTLKRAKETINALGHESVPIFFDMGLLTKALEIAWSRPDDLAGVIPCDGGMHLLMSLFAGIGKLYADAGLKGLLHESGVFAHETTNRMMLGKDFDRALYGLKLVDEALHAVYFRNFHNWLTEHDKQIPENIMDLLENLEDKWQQQQLDDLNSLVVELAEPLQKDFQPLMREFQEYGRSVSPTFQFWDDFVNKVLKPLKLFLLASKKGDWSLYQASKKWLLPLLFSSGRTTYARYMPVLVLSMERLPQDLQNFFANGNFMAKLSDGSWNNVWMDYCLETTQNKELKGSGGIIGLTMRGAALTRWFLARPVTAVYSRSFLKDVCGHEKKTASKKKASVRRWNADVQKIKQLFDGTFIDPFNVHDPPTSLVNIATGAIAPKEIEVSLLGAHDRGSQMLNTFVEERLMIKDGQEKPLKSFYDPLPRINIKTMSDMKKTVKVRDKRITLNGEVMYLRLMAVNARKKMPLTRVMSFENSPVPLSLFSDDGTMMSCKKSDFMHRLEELLPTKLTEISPVEAVIMDGHAIIQMLQPPQQQVHDSTFRDMAAMFLEYIKGTSSSLIGDNQQSQVHVIFDHYKPGSKKAQLRDVRSKDSASTTHHIQIDGKIPGKWKKFLSNAENKQQLARCYASYLRDLKHDQLLAEQHMFVSGGPNFQAFSVSQSSVQDVPELQSSQEEADTRIILHAKAAADRGAQSIVVCSPDTDVFVLLLHHYTTIGAKEIYFFTGREGKHTSLKRFIPIHDLYKKLSHAQHSILLPVYCLTGCDTVSSFYGHGKRAALKLLQQRAEQYKDMATLGSRTGISKEESDCATKFVCALYGKPECRSLNEVRCQKAESGVPPKKLPPTDNSFASHLMRSWGQLLVWREAIISIPLPHENENAGFEMNPSLNNLEPVMMTQVPAAPELLNDLLCECADGDCTENCTCAVNLQPCTASCSCKGHLPTDDEEDLCTNPFTLTSMIDSENESDSE